MSLISSLGDIGASGEMPKFKTSPTSAAFCIVVVIRGDVKIPLLKLVTFCRKTSNVCLWSFVDQLHPHHMLGLKVTWVTTANCCYTILGNDFLLNEGSNHQPFAKA